MKIIVERLDNKAERFEVEVEPNTSVKWLKALIMAKSGEPMALQHLFYRGEELEDRRQLSGCRLNDDDLVHLVVDPDAKCALVHQLDHVRVLLADISKARVFQQI